LVFHACINEMHGSRSKIPSKKSRPCIYVKLLALLEAPYIYIYIYIYMTLIGWGLFAFSVHRFGRRGIVFYFTHLTNNPQGQYTYLARYRVHDTTAAAVTKTCEYCVTNAEPRDSNLKYFLVIIGMFRFKAVNKDMNKKTAFFCVITQRVVVISYRRFRTTYRPHKKSAILIENSALLGYCAVSSGNFVQPFRDNQSAAS
jgi:hypothetical protein